MKSINYCRCFIMSELKYLASKNGLKYKIVRFEAGPEGKRAKINQKAATVDFTVYPARFEPILELTKEELEEISAFTRTMETELESAEVKEFILRYREGLSVEIISKATGGCPEIIADLVKSLKRALVPKETLEAAPDHLCFLVEGETEGNYISAYARRLGVLNKISIIKPSGNSPAEMVKEAARILALDELKGTTLREVWCVFDRDRHPSYQEAFELASRNRRIRLCWSNPCIELWFLMHFLKLPCGLTASVRFPGPTQTQLIKVSESMEKEIIEQVYKKLFNPEECLEALMKQWPSYKKNGLGYVEELHSKLPFAMVQYQNSDKDPNQIGSCFPELLKALADIAGKTLEDASEVSAVLNIDNTELLAIEEKIAAAQNKVEQARAGYLLAKSKRASQNNNKNRVYEENQAKFLKNAESRLSYLLELKEKLSSKTTQEEPLS